MLFVAMPFNSKSTHATSIPLSIIGTLDHCIAQAQRLHANGVNEIACLIDIGIVRSDVMDSLRRSAGLPKGGKR